MNVESRVIDGLHVEISGPDSAPPLIFGHSLLCNGRMWEAQVADLARDFRCVNIDFRGHGHSPAAKSGFSMADQGEDYLKVMDAVGIPKATIVGLSMGAMAAMHLVDRHPERVTALAFFNTSADPQASKLRFSALGVMARAFGLVPFLRKQAFAEMFGKSFRASGSPALAVWDAHFAALDRQGGYRALRMVVSRPSMIERLAAIRVPLMVVAGEEDTATPAACGRRIVERVPGAEWHLIPTGHLSAVENPELVTKLIREFATKVTKSI